jgi:hypothetical protein
MKTAVSILLSAAAVAGLVYYFRDKEPVATALKRSGDVLANASDIIKEKYGQVVREGQSALSEIA